MISIGSKLLIFFVRSTSMLQQRYVLEQVLYESGVASDNGHFL